MNGKRTIAATAAVFAGLLTVATLAPAAQAATNPTPSGTRVTASDPTPAGTRVTSLGATPAGTRVTSVKQADGSFKISVVGGSTAASSVFTTAAAPSTSPRVETAIIGPGQSTPCRIGYACAAVPYGSNFYVFKFVHYDGYSVSGWEGSGLFANNQTGNAGARWDNVSGGQLGCVAAGYGYYPDWHPVWRIRLTAAAC
jgi:hypothetical protein